MKVLKMHSQGDDKFDQFVKEQLDKTDVDVSLADTYFAQMQLPPAGQAPPQKRRRRWFFIWFTASCLVAITAYLLITTDANVPTTLPNHSAQTVGEPMPSPPGEPPMATDSDGGKAADPTTQPATTIAKPVDNNRFNQILTNSHAAVKDTALSADTVQHTVTNKIALDITIKDTPQVAAAKKDTASKALRTAVVPPKPKDSVYIVW
jgi:hypothetical protein